MTTSKRGKQRDPMEDFLEQFIKGLLRGIKQVYKSKIKLLILVLVTTACGVIFYLRNFIISTFIPGPDFHVLKIFVSLALLVPVGLIYLMGSSEEESADEYEKKFAEIKFCGKGGSYPQYLSQEEDGKKIIFSFHTPGLNINEWRNKQRELETVLDCNIVKFQTAKETKQVIKLHTIPASETLSTNLTWKNEFIKEDDFVLTAGEGLLEEVTFDLNKYPHALIAGVTGSGKSVILRCMLWQCIKKGARIYMIDFKGGVEFGQDYEAFGEVITERQEALELMKNLVKEMKLRLDIFRTCGVKNIIEYNQMFLDQPLCRIVLVCDEIAEMLDKTGLAKADAGVFYELEKEMSSLARLARSPGINMLLATQRPDAKVIVGQIKNNLPIRISGRMIDPQASEMVLGNALASTLGDTLGRFMYTIGSDTYEFQAYNFKDSALIEGNYQFGTMLLEDRKLPQTFSCLEENEEEEFYAEAEDFEEEEDWEGFY